MANQGMLATQEAVVGGTEGVPGPTRVPPPPHSGKNQAFSGQRPDRSAFSLFFMETRKWRCRCKPPKCSDTS
jgi:hypothetical protein